MKFSTKSKDLYFFLPMVFTYIVISIPSVLLKTDFKYEIQAFKIFSPLIIPTNFSVVYYMYLRGVNCKLSLELLFDSLLFFRNTEQLSCAT